MTFLLLPLLVFIFSLIVFITNRAAEKRKNDNGIADDYETRKCDQKYIDGKPIADNSQYAEWSVLKGFSMALASHLTELCDLAESGMCEDYTKLRLEWEEYYGRLRELCIRHKLWNPITEDHAIFVPTEYQLSLEQAARVRLDEACEIGIERARMIEEIMAFIQSCPYHCTVRKNMVNILANGDDQRKKLYRSVCDRMIRNNLLSTSHDEEGQLIVRKKRKSSAGKNTESLPPSVFRQEVYRHIDERMLYKVKHTVGTPMQLDRQGNRCRFISLSNGKEYETSLEKCTCMAYQNGYSPCKHMVALAKYLRYI